MTSISTIVARIPVSTENVWMVSTGMTASAIKGIGELTAERRSLTKEVRDS